MSFNWSNKKNNDPTEIQYLDKALPPNFFTTIKNSKSLQKLNLVGNNLTDNDIKNLIQALNNNNSLKYLGINKNNVSDNGADQIVNFIMLHPKIEEIDLRENKISSQGAIVIAKALEQTKNSNLTKISFELNPKIKDKGKDALITALTKNHNITSLVLDNMTENQLKCWYDAIQFNLKGISTNQQLS